MKGGARSNKKYIILGAFVILISVLILVRPGIIGFTLFEPGTDAYNNPPQWTSAKREFHITREKTYDLNEYFTDPDGDALTYLSTSYDNLKVTIDQNKVTFTPTSPGEYKIGLIASDGDATAKVRVVVVAT